MHNNGFIYLNSLVKLKNGIKVIVVLVNETKMTLTFKNLYAGEGT